MTLQEFADKLVKAWVYISEKWKSWQKHYEKHLMKSIRKSRNTSDCYADRQNGTPKPTILL